MAQNKQKEVVDYAVKVEGLTKAYKLYKSPRDRLKEAFNIFGRQYHQPFNALEALDISIPRGSTTGIIGRNGSGKSTLLQCICGIVTPSAGSVKVNGKIAALLELGAGFNPEFTGRDNLYINGSILGLTTEEIDARLEDILAFADIGDYIDQPVRSYSSGMFVRLAFSIAIHVDPDILIVDEALAVGDIHFQAKCFDRFHQFREQGTTVIFVTHDLNMVTRYCDQAYLLSKGKIVRQGQPREVVAEYRKLEVGFDEAEKERKTENQNEVIVAETVNPFAENPYEVRYGDNRAIITNGGIYDDQDQPVQTLDSGSNYTVRMIVAFEEDIDDPVFAFTIKDAKGTEIAGTNTHFAKVKTGSFKKGQSATISFIQNVTLNAGSFLLSLGCVDLSSKELKIYDRRHDFLSFQILSQKATVGIVDLGTLIKIEK
jgi:teichoic acid transport system ATP-binding protein